MLNIGKQTGNNPWTWVLNGRMNVKQSCSPESVRPLDARPWYGQACFLQSAYTIENIYLSVPLILHIDSRTHSIVRMHTNFLSYLSN